MHEAFDWVEAPPGAPCPKPAPVWYIVVCTYRLRYDIARPFSSRTPCVMPSPKNQCGESPTDGFEPLRTYRPFSSGGNAPCTRRLNDSISLGTGAKLPCIH